MTKDEALKLSLEALDKYGFAPCDKEEDWQGFKRAITAIKEALAQPERPVDCERCNRLEDALKGANGLAEHFERAWYLRGDEIERLTAQPKQEPVATVESVATVVSESGNQEVTMSWWHEPALPVGTKLYTTPPQRTWVGLTDEEVDECYYWKDRQWTTDELVRHVEAKLKEKNTRQDGDCKHCVNGCPACDARRQA